MLVGKKFFDPSCSVLKKTTHQHFFEKKNSSKGDLKKNYRHKQKILKK
jgi:hypothetical protein